MCVYELRVINIGIEIHENFVDVLNFDTEQFRGKE